MTAEVNAVRTTHMLQDMKTQMALAFMLITHNLQTKTKRKYNLNNVEHKFAGHCLAYHRFRRRYSVIFIISNHILIKEEERRSHIYHIYIYIYIYI
jgi:hypothetical protein